MFFRVIKKILIPQKRLFELKGEALNGVKMMKRKNPTLCPKNQTLCPNNVFAEPSSPMCWCFGTNHIPIPKTKSWPRRCSRKDMPKNEATGKPLPSVAQKKRQVHSVFEKKGKTSGFWDAKVGLPEMRTASTMQQKFFSLHSINREKEEFCKQMAASQILCSLFYLQKELRSSSRHQQKQKIIHILSLSRWAQKTHSIQKTKGDRTFWQILWAKKLLVKEKNELTKNFKQTRFWISIRKLTKSLDWEKV